ncbi:MAG TPA: O-antigen ligase family protein [Stellaceae bacterium]|jgi:O-antigen ligase|nr:O-antigen ligase family protein [Stellaceae bacterium]
MKFIAARVEFLVSILFLWIATGIFWPPASYFNKTALALDASDPTSTAAHIVFIALLIVVAIVRRDDMLWALRCGWPLLPLLALAYLSAFWSDAPTLVLRRSTTLAITTVFAMYLTVRYELPRLISILLKLSVVGVVGSFTVMVVAPDLALGGSIDYPNAIRGAYTAKNTLGGISSFGIIIAVYALWRGYGSRLIAGALIPANLALLLVSQSATALLLVVAATYVATLASALRRRSGAGLVLGFAMIVLGLAGIGLLALGWDEVLAALNRNPTLTGRAQIWRMALADIGHRPWFGYGYGAFWRQSTVEARNMWTIVFWIVPHAHNAWLEAGLALGIVGMIGITWLWLTAFYRSLRLLTEPSAQHVVFCMALFIAILIENLTEYEFFRADSFFWVLFVVAFTDLGSAALGVRRIEARSPLALGATPGLAPAMSD